MSLFKDIPIKSFRGYSNFQRDRIVSANSIGQGFTDIILNTELFKTVTISLNYLL